MIVLRFGRKQLKCMGIKYSQTLLFNHWGSYSSSKLVRLRILEYVRVSWNVMMQYSSCILSDNWMSYSTGWLRRYGEITFFWVWPTSAIIHCPSYSLTKPLHIPLNPHLYLVFDNIFYIMFAVSRNAMYYVLHELLYYGSLQLCRWRSILTIFLWPFLFSYCSGIFPGSALKESSLAPYSLYLTWQSLANTTTCSFFSIHNNTCLVHMGPRLIQSQFTLILSIHHVTALL